MFSFLDKLRKKSIESRKTFAVLSALFITLIIASIWYFNISNNRAVAENTEKGLLFEEQVATPFENLKNEIAQFFEMIKGLKDISSQLK